jgi:hypothetical protein
MATAFGRTLTDVTRARVSMRSLVSIVEKRTVVRARDPSNRGREQFTPRYVSREFQKQHLGNYYRLATRHPDEHLVSGDRSRYFRSDVVNGGRVTGLPGELGRQDGFGAPFRYWFRQNNLLNSVADICGAYLLKRR